MKYRKFFFVLLFCSFFAQAQLELVVLGTAQDAGAPQIGCEKSCCKTRWKTGKKEAVVALGVIDQKHDSHYLFEATPDIGQQLHDLAQAGGTSQLDGVFLTHAHIGHYSGLMFLGKEALGGKNIPVYSFPKMRKYLETNGPWEQLVSENNIALNTLTAAALTLSENLKIVPFTVPHRDEYSETVGYTIIGPNKTALFIPDIDKWERWETSIEELIKKVDYAFLDATFYDGSELPNRDMNAIPHPFVVESMERLSGLSPEDKKKVYFIHFNHTNPLLNENSTAVKTVQANGFQIARKGLKVAL